MTKAPVLNVRALYFGPEIYRAGKQRAEAIRQGENRYNGNQLWSKAFQAMNKNRSSAPLKRTSTSRWPFALLPATILLAPVLSHSLPISPTLASFAALLIWAPFTIWDYLRRTQMLNEEKKAMQDRFDAQDEALFGKKLDSW